MMVNEAMTDCNIYLSERVAVAICDYGVCGLRIDGEDVETDKYGEYQLEDVRRAAEIAAGEKLRIVRWLK